jgi:hypothetical protein
MGSSIDDFFKEEGIFEAAHAQPIKEVVAAQPARATERKRVSKATRRAQVNRLVGPKNSITLSSLRRAGAMVGRRVMTEQVPGNTGY